MRAAPFEYVAPSSLTAVVAALDECTGTAALLAGGQTLVPEMLRRQRTPEVLVDLRNLADLTRVEVDEEGAVELGAMVTLSDLMGHDRIRAGYGIAAHILRQIANPAVRNVATVGGSAALAAPHGGVPLTLIVLDALITLRSSGGVRRVEAEEYFSAPGRATMRRGEVLTHITMRPSGFADQRTGWGFRCVAPQDNAPFILAVACTIAVGADGRIDKARLAACGSSGLIRLGGFEQDLVDRAVVDVAPASLGSRFGQVVAPELQGALRSLAQGAVDDALRLARNEHRHA